MFLLIHVVEFVYYACLVIVTDAFDRLVRDEPMPEAMRLYRQILALKALTEAQARELAQRPEPRRVPLATRAAEVFAAILTRRDHTFRQYWLPSTLATIDRWASRFRHFGLGRRRRGVPGRPPKDPKVVELVLTLKGENPNWGHVRITQELRRMGVQITQPTVARILIENGFPPAPKREMTFEILRAAARDAVWAVDFFAVRTAKGKLLQVLLIIDVYTREIMDLRVHDGWDVDSIWTCRALNRVCADTQRTPKQLLHDHGGQFESAQFQRNLRVMEIEDVHSVVHMPWTNCWAERAIYSVRRELLNHLLLKDADQIQWYLDEYRAFSNTTRPHQGIGGKTPHELAESKPPAEVIPVEELREARLVRKTFAKGLLQGYALERKAA